MDFIERDLYVSAWTTIPLISIATSLKAMSKNFWQKEFPERIKNLEVIILADQKVEISVQVRSMEEEEKIAFLEKSEREIGNILSNILDYNHEFFLTLNV